MKQNGYTVSRVDLETWPGPGDAPNAVTLSTWVTGTVGVRSMRLLADGWLAVDHVHSGKLLVPPHRIVRVFVP